MDILSIIFLSDFSLSVKQEWMEYYPKWYLSNFPLMQVGDLACSHLQVLQKELVKESACISKTIHY